MLIMSSTTFIKLGLWVWCSSIVSVASVALEPAGGCGARGRLWSQRAAVEPAGGCGASGAVGGRTGCGSHRVGAEERLRWTSGAGPKVADATAFERI